MWTRASLKERGRRAFLANYWYAVIAALLLSIFFLGGSSGYSSSARNQIQANIDNGEFSIDGFSNYPDGAGGSINSQLQNSLGTLVRNPLVIALGGFTALVLLALFAARYLLISPMEVGLRRFFSANLYGKARFSEIGFAYKYIWMKSAGILFLRDLKVFLWTLLLIVPGIVKSYQYKMVPYLLAENPNLTSSEAFALSKQMMDGEKWDAFVLSLSFIGWELLSVVTLGILGLLYVNPYMASTEAALYRELRYKVNF